MPVTNGLDSIVKNAQVRRATLNEVREAARKGDAEIALLPTSDAFGLANYSIIPCCVVAAAGASRLFTVFAKCLPTEIRRVLVDPEDLGAVNLAKFLFAKKLMVRPEYYRAEKTIDPGEYDLKGKDGFDAYLLCGRHSFHVRRDAFAFTWDLTLAWYEYARLPFVIHCWVVKKGVQLGRVERELADAARRNLHNDDAAARAAEKLQMSQSSVTAVYEKALWTEFNSTMVTSLRRYAQELAQNRIQHVQPFRIHSESGLSTTRSITG
jgi:predicted solute-binding protein